MAEIILCLYENQQLNLGCRSLEDNSKYNFKGNWMLNNGFYELTFIKDKSGAPDLYTLFDDSRGRVMILNKNQVKFHETETRIKIWGITCVKK